MIIDDGRLKRAPAIVHERRQHLIPIKGTERTLVMIEFQHLILMSRLGQITYWLPRRTAYALLYLVY
jgi:hypothetical protein